jgi:hypothetical protein
MVRLFYWRSLLSRQQLVHDKLEFVAGKLDFQLPSGLFEPLGLLFLLVRRLSLWLWPWLCGHISKFRQLGV